LQGGKFARAAHSSRIERVTDAAMQTGRLEPVLRGYPGLDLLTLANHQPLRGNGKGAWFGWPDDPELETRRNA
jgi:peptide/nickel transport system substrate-binding protein